MENNLQFIFNRDIEALSLANKCRICLNHLSKVLDNAIAVQAIFLKIHMQDLIEVFSLSHLAYNMLRFIEGAIITNSYMYDLFASNNLAIIQDNRYMHSYHVFQNTYLKSNLLTSDDITSIDINNGKQLTFKNINSLNDFVINRRKNLYSYSNILEEEFNNIIKIITHLNFKINSPKIGNYIKENHLIRLDHSELVVTGKRWSITINAKSDILKCFHILEKYNKLVPNLSSRTCVTSLTCIRNFVQHCYPSILNCLKFLEEIKNVNETITGKYISIEQNSVVNDKVDIVADDEDEDEDEDNLDDELLPINKQIKNKTVRFQNDIEEKREEPNKEKRIINKKRKRT